MPYSETLAESYLQAKDNERTNGATGEDPLFRQMAGDNKEFVGGIPKETWEGMSPGQRENIVRGTDEDRKQIGEYGAAIGGTLGVVASIPAYSAGPIPGGIVSGTLGSYGAAKGYNVGYDYYDKVAFPSTISREDLNRQYEEAKDRE